MPAAPIPLEATSTGWQPQLHKTKASISGDCAGRWAGADHPRRYGRASRPNMVELLRCPLSLPSNIFIGRGESGARQDDRISRKLSLAGCKLRHICLTVLVAYMGGRSPVADGRPQLYGGVIDRPAFAIQARAIPKVHPFRSSAIVMVRVRVRVTASRSISRVTATLGLGIKYISSTRFYLSCSIAAG